MRVPEMTEEFVLTAQFALVLVGILGLENIAPSFKSTLKQE